MQIGRIFLPSGNVQNLPKQNELGVRPSAQYLLTLREDIIYQNTLYVNMRGFFNNLMLIILELFRPNLEKIRKSFGKNIYACFFMMISSKNQENTCIYGFCADFFQTLIEN